MWKDECNDGDRHLAEEEDQETKGIEFEEACVLAKGSWNAKLEL